MADMLVNLLNLPPLDPVIEGMRRASVVVRRAAPYEITPVRRFVERHFTTAWADEISVGYANKPVSVYLAIRAGEVIGFSAYECTRRGFFGPTGVADSERGKGVGKALLLASLHGLAELGYAYGIIGGVGPADFYARTVGATLIPGSTPGVYADPLSEMAPHDDATPSR
ncbi:GNAT family N-acetyltransferase [Sorangium sp. So ce1389]|uniref:GNAT family N-acetyltransferase n=1 Tax=Sorangium sp. So ce1389 TaxID=3133336 RepID=UPI003F5DC244